MLEGSTTDVHTSTSEQEMEPRTLFSISRAIKIGILNLHFHEPKQVKLIPFIGAKFVDVNLRGSITVMVYI